MPVMIEAHRVGSESATRSLNVALINNLSDAALDTTERQFAGLIAAATRGAATRWQRYRLLPCGTNGSVHYANLTDLRQDRPNLIIVTGLEPTTVDLRDEEIWWPLVDLLDWADESGTPIILSCLAAHAAVLHFDGIRRVPLDRKRFGVFPHQTLLGDDRGSPPGRELLVAHSRWNELPESVLIAHGYRPLTRSEEAGVDLFVSDRNTSMLFCQGHPEYSPETLLREYRRDVTRFLKGERDSYPDMPTGCLRAAATAVANAFRRKAEAEREVLLRAVFPYQFLADQLDRSWHFAAAGQVGHWIDTAFLRLR